MSRNFRYAAMPMGAALALVTALASPAAAHGADLDHDGMSNTFEVKFKLNPRSSADAKADLDKDGLNNLRESKVGGNPRDEDTDNDGQDDADELISRTKVTVADTDRDRITDGDEDVDRDRIANEDEDDPTEVCAADDDDVDRDNVDDEDENELRLTVGKTDTDGDRLPDGAEDLDGDAVANEDEDDNVGDRCSQDLDRDGEDDEDEGDRFGVISSFDTATGTLVVTNVGGVIFSVLVTEDTEIKFDDESGRDEDATEAALIAGAGVAELDIDRKTGELEEIELL